MNNLALHKLSYGLYVLSTKLEKKPFGCIVNTVFQITSNPPRIAVSCNRDNFTHDKIKMAGIFGISVLAEDTAPELIGTFGYNSGRNLDKFEEHPSEKGRVLQLPLFSNDAVATFECRLVDKMEVGTHTLFIGEVIDCDVNRSNANEMTYRYYHEIRNGVAPKNAPTFIETKSKKESWECSVCGYIYDDHPSFEELPDDWICPICGATKELFNKQ